MRQTLQRWSVMALICAFLAGCLATPGAPGGASSEKADAQETAAKPEEGPTVDPRLQGEQAEFFSRSGLQACAVAAGVGIGLCLLTSNDKLKCSIIAGVAACGVAAGANYYLETRRGKYADSTKRLEAMTADVKEDSKRVQANSDTAREVMKEDRARMAQLSRDIKRKQVDTEKGKRDLAQIDLNLAAMRKQAEGMRKKTKDYQTVLDAEKKDSKRSTPELAKVEKEIQQLNKQVASLEKEIDSAYAQRAAITLG